MRDGERLRVGAAVPRGALRVAACFAGVLLATASTALAQGALEAAGRAYDEGRIEEAARAYRDALESGSLEPAGLVRAHLRLGILAALEGDAASTDRSFEIALALDPIRDAPDELSPELRARFDALRAARGGRRVTLVIERVDGGIMLGVRDAPEGLARTIEVRGGGGFEARVAWEGAPIRVDPPVEALPIEAALFDAHGNRIARAGARLDGAVAAVATAASARGQEGPGRNLLESPWLWIVVGAIVIGIGVTVGVSASGDRYVLDPPVIR